MLGEGEGFVVLNLTSQGPQWDIHFVLLATWKLKRDHEVVRNDVERSCLVAGNDGTSHS